MVKRSEKDIEKRKEKLIYELLKKGEMDSQSIAEFFKMNRRTAYTYIKKLQPLILHLSGGKVILNKTEAKKYLKKELDKIQNAKKILFEREEAIKKFLEES